MNLNRNFEELKNLIRESYYELLASIGAVLLFVSNLFFSYNNGIYLILTLSIIVIEIIIGSLFLLFNTTALVLASLIQSSLSPIEKRWVKQKIQKNSIVIVIWLIFSILTFLIITPHLGVIAGLYLVSLIMIFRFAGKEENPFLEQTYEL
ncbi:MAG: hypothetical protein ACFE9L_01260 [Candidatus Hodarchaeota archaeon]